MRRDKENMRRLVLECITTRREVDQTRILKHVYSGTLKYVCRMYSI